MRHRLETIIDRVATGLGYVNGKSVEDAVRALISEFEEKYSSPPDVEPAREVDLYRKDVWVYASIYAIATGLAGLPLKLRQKVRDQVVDVDQHGALAVLDNPNQQGMSRFDLVEAIVSWLEISGNCYLATSKSDVGGWSGLWPLPSHLVEILSTGGGRDGPMLAGAFRMRDQHGGWVQFEADEIIHFRYFGTNRVYGMSFLEPSMSAANGHLNVNRWNSNFMHNSARPDVVAESDKEYNAKADGLIKNWWNSNHRGVSNAHRMGIGWSGLKFKIVSHRPKDMDFKNMTSGQKQEMLGAAGVPPFKVSDLEHASWANSREQNAGFYRDTLMPKARKVAGTLTRALHRDWPGAKEAGLYFEFDFSGVEALQEDRAAKHDRIRADYLAGAILLDEFREETGRDALPGGAGQVLYAPGAAVAGSAPVEGRMVKEAELISVSTLVERVTRSLPRVASVSDNAETIRRSLLWRQFSQVTEESENAIAGVYGDLLKDQTEDAIDRLQAVSWRPEAIGTALDFLSDEQAILAASENFRPHLLDAAKIGAARADNQVEALVRRAVERVVPPDQAALLDASVDAFAASRAADLVALTNAYTKSVIRKVVVDGIQSGLSETAIAELLRLRLGTGALDRDEIEGEFGGPRTLTIARTEAAAAYNFGTLANYEHNDAVGQKEWLSSRDQAVRNITEDGVEHGIDGQRRNLKDPFDVPTNRGMVQLQYPGEYSGADPGATINCRCTMIPVIEGGFS